MKEVGVFSTEINQKDKSEAVMEQYKKEFIEFMIDCNVLKFGDFVTKSGRKTPFLLIPDSTVQALS